MTADGLYTWGLCPTRELILPKAGLPHVANHRDDTCAWCGEIRQDDR